MSQPPGTGITGGDPPFFPPQAPAASMPPPGGPTQPPLFSNMLRPAFPPLGPSSAGNLGPPGNQLHKEPLLTTPQCPGSDFTRQASGGESPQSNSMVSSTSVPSNIGGPLMDSSSPAERSNLDGVALRIPSQEEDGMHPQLPPPQFFPRGPPPGSGFPPGQQGGPPRPGGPHMQGMPPRPGGPPMQGVPPRPGDPPSSGGPPNQGELPRLGGEPPQSGPMPPRPSVPPMRVPGPGGELVQPVAFPGPNNELNRPMGPRGPLQQPSGPPNSNPLGDQRPSDSGEHPGGIPNRLPRPPPGEMSQPPILFRGQPPPGNRPPMMNRPPRDQRFADAPHPLMGRPPRPFPFHRGPFPPGDFPPPESMEVWFEHATADGEVYYSHPQTRKTTWERPLNVHIVQPPPFAGGPHGAGGQFPDGGPFGNIPPFSPGLPPPPQGNSQLVPTRVWTEHQTPDGKVYFYNKVTKQSVWERPKDFELIMPLPMSFSTPPSNTVPVAQPAAAEKSDDESGEAMETTDVDSGRDDSMKEDEQKKVDGTEQVTDASTAATATNPPANQLMSSPSPANTPNTVPDPIQPPLISSIPPQTIQPPSAPVPLPMQPPIRTPVTPPASFHPPIPIPVKQEPKGPRPIASHPIAGTPWSIVWSSDNRAFFFNVSNHTSVWSTPEELKDNIAVQKILESPLGGKKRSGEMGGGPDTKHMRLSDSEDSDEDTITIAEGVAIVNDPQTKPSETAEEYAAQARVSKTLEERQQEFKEMLLERGVSAFSTWEKELPKFVFDPRYMLLTVKERKTCFEAFIRSRTEEERRERKSKLKEARDSFKSLLEGAKLHPKSSFSEFASKYSKDERFKTVEKMREREQLFTEFLGELKKSGGRLKEEHKVSSKNKTEKVNADFLAMLKESDIINKQSHWKKVKSKFDHDPRYKAVDSSSRREELFKEYLKELDKPLEVDPEQERQDRIMASLKEREREVQMSRSAHEKEWGRERDQLRKMEAQQLFKALLVDLVRTSQVQWHEAKKSLRKDHRWESTRLIDHDEKEDIFQKHVMELENKKRLQFRKLLEETAQITLNMPWRKARKLIKEDPRYKNFTDSDHKREVEYDKYQIDRMVRAKNEFRSLLKETKLITYKSFDLVRESERHYKDILDLLKNDKRFLVLDCIPEEREDILYGYIGDLHRKGPPPPPTATHPGERLKRPGPP